MISLNEIRRRKEQIAIELEDLDNLVEEFQDNCPHPLFYRNDEDVCTLCEKFLDRNYDFDVQELFNTELTDHLNSSNVSCDRCGGLGIRFMEEDRDEYVGYKQAVRKSCPECYGRGYHNV